MGLGNVAGTGFGGGGDVNSYYCDKICQEKINHSNYLMLAIVYCIVV